MSLIKVGDRIFNLNAIASIQLNVERGNEVQINFLNGDTMRFDGLEAVKVREHFSASKDVKDLMEPLAVPDMSNPFSKPRKPLSFS